MSETSMSEKEKNYREVLKMEFRRQLKQVLINYPMVGAEVLRKSDLDKKKAEKIETIVMDPEAIFAGSYVLDIDSIIRAVVCYDKAIRSISGPTAKDKANALEIYNKCMKKRPL